MIKTHTKVVCDFSGRTIKPGDTFLRFAEGWVSMCQATDQKYVVTTTLSADTGVIKGQYDVSIQYVWELLQGSKSSVPTVTISQLEKAISGFTKPTKHDPFKAFKESR